MPDPYFPLPVTFDEITPEWLTHAFGQRCPGAIVHAAEIVSMKRGTSTKIWLALQRNDAAIAAGIPATVVLKGGFEPHSRDLAYMHRKEVRAYHDILGNLGLRSPACYFSAFDEAREQGIVIIEDLVSRGVDFCHPLQPQSHDAVAARLSALARFHAQTWGSDGHDTGGRWSDLEYLLDYLQRDYFSEYLRPEAWADFIAKPRGAAVSVRFHDRDWMVQAIETMRRHAHGLPICVLHADTHLGNLYVDTDGAPGFFDSLSSRGPGLLEAAYHISCALDPYDRRRWEAPLVRHYLDALASHGIAAPGFDDAMRQYGLFLAFGFAIWIVNEATFQTEAANTAYAARLSAAMIDNDTPGLLASLSD